MRSLCAALLSLLLLLATMISVNEGFTFEEKLAMVENPDLIPDLNISIPYEKASRFVEMRDGVSLFTVWYKPLWPITNLGTVFERTPYTTLSAIYKLGLEYLLLGFVVMAQDQRGSGASRGDTYQFWRKDGQDAFDSLEWINSHSWSNGRVFMTGPSADGNAVYAALLESSPYLRAIAPHVATAQGHQTTYQGGAFRQGLVQNWLLLLAFPFTLQEVKENEAYSDWWDSIEMKGKEDRCNVPGVHFGGWYDIFQNENIDAFNACQYISTNPGARSQQKLVMDPRGHCPLGEVTFPNDRILLPRQLRHELFLRENSMEVPVELARAVAEADAITIYVMGPDRAATGNYWTTIPTWPAINSTAFYLHPDRSLQLTPPDASSGNSSTSYFYDPRDPVGTIGGNELLLPCGPRDQSELESRQDVLVFTSDPLKENLALVGDLSAVLFVSSDAVDTDFTVKITDVYPDGRSMLLADGIIRMRWRDSREVPVLMTSGVVYKVNVHLWKTAFIFETGHSIRVAISSSNHPRFEKNPNNGLPIIETGAEIVAYNTLHHNYNNPSYLLLPQVNINDIPNNYNPQIDHHPHFNNNF